MQRNRPPSAQAIGVLRALAADPAQWRYGYDLAAEVHLKSGSPTAACWRRPGSPAREAGRPGICTG